jgi:hypothetical protein
VTRQTRGRPGARPLPVLLLLGILLSVLLPAAAASSPTAVRAPSIDIPNRVRCSFDSEDLGEVSGLALSRRHPDVVWMTNDSGGGPYLYAVDAATCRTRATLTLLDTPARDHEALATGTDAEGRDVIWIGDIGDNQDLWPYARIHKVVEPSRLRDQAVPVTTYRFTYPGGPENAEAILADPDSERLWVITKEAGQGGLYALPSPMSDSRTPMRAKKVSTARALITDAAMSPDGERYVVRDYLSAEVFTGVPPGTAEARFRLPFQPQGEAVTWTADGLSLLVASEGSADLIEVPVPQSALGTDRGISAALPRVAGFDIYPYLRIVVVGLVGVALLVLVRRAVGRRRAR